MSTTWPSPRLIPLLSRRGTCVSLLLTGLWVLAVAIFWAWWVRPMHVIEPWRFALNTAVLAWFTLMPGYLLVVLLRARRADPGIALPAGLRVAMVVTKAPSEPFPVVRETLEAMLAQAYPHDTWLADEDPAPETIAWCAEHGVSISTRKGRADYHMTTWPRRTRCKEGNLAFFYDHFGYDRYDFVAQLDADHVPQPGYLEAMLRPFADPGIGYVSAPSICDRNAEGSWSARGRLHVEGAVHGALQSGYTGMLAPVCIGSHYAVRTAALRQIGGLGPELAEDHSTTMMMNAHGWRGVHAIDALAHGDGPQTFADLITQEFQWSRSLITLLIQYTPRYVGRLPARLRFQFLFCQSWYPVFGLAMALMYALPLVALFTDSNLVRVAYVDFFLAFNFITAALIAVIVFWRAQGWLRPYNARILSWEAMLYMLARWPWWLVGTFAAIKDCVTGKKAEFRVTPKGVDAARHAPYRAILPYVLLSLGSSLPLFMLGEVHEARGFYLFAVLNALLYAVLAVTVLYRHRLENPSPAGAAHLPLRQMLPRVALTMTMVVAVLAAAPLRTPQAVQSFLFGSERLLEPLVLVTGSAANPDTPARSDAPERQPAGPQGDL